MRKRKDKKTTTTGLRGFLQSLWRYSAYQAGLESTSLPSFSIHPVWMWMGLLLLVSALAFYSSSLQIAKLSIKPADSLSFERAILLASEQGDYELSERLYTEGVQQNYLSASSLPSLELEVYPLQRRERMLDTLINQASNQPTPLVNMFTRMHVLLELKRYETAAAAWQEIFYLQPNSAEVREALFDYAYEFPAFTQEILLQQLD